MTAVAIPLGGSAVLLSRHVDALELTCAVQQVPKLLMHGTDDRLERILKKHQDEARALRPRSPVESDWMWGDAERVRAHPTGIRPGVRYCIECADWMGFIAATNSVLPRMSFQLRADYLVSVGAVGAFDALVPWVERTLLPLVGGRPVEDVPRWGLARLDVAADVLGAGITETDLHRFTTRAVARETHHDGWDFL